MSLGLLLASEEAEAPWELPLEAMPSQSPLPPRPRGGRFLGARDGDFNDLGRQRWALVVPKDGGKPLAEAVRELVKLREDEQGAAVKIYEIDGLSDDDAVNQWCREVYESDAERESQRPRYLVLLGDAHQLSLSLQQALGRRAQVGRLAFPSLDDYRRYAAKVVARARTASRTPARVLLATAVDGSIAPGHGDGELMRPLHARCQEGVPLDEPRARGVSRLLPGSPAELLEGLEDVQVLMSLGHGVGPPRGGWSDDQRRRARQGALKTAHGALTVTDVATGPFLPGGVWIHFACFGAATPSVSAYSPWLAQLAQLQPAAHQLASALAPQPFVAALPQAALANPDGPLAVIGHVDLVWSYSYRDLDQNPRVSRFHELINILCRGSRVGLALRQLDDACREAESELARLHQQLAGQHPVSRLRLADLWMQRNDLDGFILLGDPAARLAV